MRKTINIIETHQTGISKRLDELTNKDMIFRKKMQDTVGRSGSNPTWGLAFDVVGNKLKFKGEGLYKEYDYDYPNGAYAEKVASIIGRELFAGEIRVPEIDVVLKSIGEPSLISYKLMNNKIEDMHHISDLMFYKFEREELDKKKSIFKIEDILECIHVLVKDEENYKQIEKGLIKALLFDSVINNGDRHNNNWALVRNEETNWFELAIYDHFSSCVDMIQEQEHFTSKGWVGSYVIVGEEPKSGMRMGSTGDQIIEYISKTYPEYFEEFVTDFNKKLPQILQLIKQERLPIDFNRLETKLNRRKHMLNKLLSKGEQEYE